MAKRTPCGALPCGATNATYSSACVKYAAWNAKTVKLKRVRTICMLEVLGMETWNGPMAAFLSTVVAQRGPFAGIFRSSCDDECKQRQMIPDINVVTDCNQVTLKADWRYR